MENQNFNPFFVFYSRFHGRGPAEQLAQDRIDWPGGCMIGFMLWMREKKNEFYSKSPSSFLGRDAIYDIAAWGEFLDTASRV